MPNHHHIYRHEAERYDALIGKQPDLLAVIRSICDPAGKDIIDLGAGTGRLTVPLAGAAKSIVATDASAAMLEVAEARLKRLPRRNWSTIVADNRAIPLDDGSADLLVSGWSICYTASSDEADWERNLAVTMGEIGRVLRPGGTAIIFETLGTGVETPSPPAFLTGYYAALERDYGCRHRWIRTDYTFDDAAQAAELAGFFFGDAIAALIVSRGWRTLPECAGVWWFTVS